MAERLRIKSTADSLSNGKAAIIIPEIEKFHLNRCLDVLLSPRFVSMVIRIDERSMSILQSVERADPVQFATLFSIRKRQPKCRG